MEDNRYMRIIRLIMIDLSGLNLLLITLFVHATLRRMVRSGTALAFLQQAGRVPMTPLRMEIYASLLYFSLLVLLVLSRKSHGRALFFMYAFLTTGISFCLIRLFGSSVDEILFLTAACLLVFSCRMVYKVPVFLFLFVFYIACEAGDESFGFSAVPLTIYRAYYTGSVRAGISFYETGMGYLQTALIVFYFVLAFRLQLEETERVKALNQELDAANTSLQAANERLRQYALTSEAMAETRERNRLAREIHDTLGHTLTGIISSLDACLTLIRISPEAAKSQIEKTQKVAREGMKDVRRSVNALRPDKLERLSLEEAIRQMVQEMKDASGADIRLSVEIGDGAIAEDEAEAVYRIVQESVTNALRHGGADRIEISISRVYDQLEIQVQDNGTGCSDIKPGFGLRHMKERLDLLNGTLRYGNIESEEKQTSSTDHSSSEWENGIEKIKAPGMTEENREIRSKDIKSKDIRSKDIRRRESIKGKGNENEKESWEKNGFLIIATIPLRWGEEA